jgi:hypothetical protein
VYVSNWRRGLRLGAEDLPNKGVLLEGSHDDTVTESVRLEIGRTPVGDTLSSEIEDVAGTRLVVA